MASPKLEPLVLSEHERQVLQGWAGRSTAQRLVLRSRIVLACAGGAPVTAVAGELGVSRVTAAKWRSRFLEARLKGLSDEPRPGRPRTITDEHVERVVTATLEQEPPGGRTRWSTRSMARHEGMSQTAIARIWRAFGFKPHVVHASELSTNPHFADTVRGVAGLYMDPPDNTLVLCAAEGPQTQAPDRHAATGPVLPALPNRVTHDGLRDGPASQPAAVDATDGLVTGQRHRRRDEEFLRFLRLVDRAVPDDLDLHLICGNSATCQAPQIKNWLLRHPGFHQHIIPPSSWQTVAERWLAELTSRQLPPSAHRSVDELHTLIRKWARERDKSPGPFVWITTGGRIADTLAAHRILINNSECQEDARTADGTGPACDCAKPRPSTVLAAERKDLLLARLRRDGKLVARDLAAELGLSEDSVRRDLREIAAAGLCQRVYGGALPASPALGTMASRYEIAPDSKRRVAARAAGLITPGATVILGGGTTAEEVVAALPADLDATIITPSATTAAALAGHPKVKVLMLGGLLHKQSVTTTGATAAEAASDITADLALLTLPGVHPHEGLTASDPEVAALTRILISRAADTYVMASTEKLGTVAAYKVTGLPEVAGIITDAPADHPTLQQLRDQGSTIIRAAR
jgi:DeoR/GlpR family transcriptional regulator of sugar metabolism/transposase